MSKLLVERDGGVTLFRLNRPDVHNKVDADLAVELAEGIIAFRDDDSAPVLVITGAGDVAGDRREHPRPRHRAPV